MTSSSSHQPSNSIIPDEDSQPVLLAGSSRSNSQLNTHTKVVDHLVIFSRLGIRTIQACTVKSTSAIYRVMETFKSVESGLDHWIGLLTEVVLYPAHIFLSPPLHPPHPPRVKLLANIQHSRDVLTGSHPPFQKPTESDPVSALLHSPGTYGQDSRLARLIVHAHFGLYEFFRLQTDFAEEDAWVGPLRLLFDAMTMRSCLVESE